MGDKVTLLRPDDYSPVFRLLVSLVITLIAGTITFWLLIFCGSLIFDTTVSGMVTTPFQGAAEMQIRIVRYLQISQQIGLFFVPAVLIASLFRKKGISFLMIDHPPALYDTILIVILILIIIPVISWTGLVNSGLKLPDWLSGIENLIREKEAKAAGILGTLMGSGGIGTMTLNLFILAIIPSFAEEFLFRGVYQQLLISLFRSKHAGVWVTAIMFSAVHFQFYGFLPRMMLGLLFGYLFLWSANLWSAIIPHFLNNAVPVVLTYIAEKREVTGNIQEEIRAFPFIQMVLSVLIIYYIWYKGRTIINTPDKKMN